MKLSRNDAAIAAYNKAAPLLTNPAVAYFNICAIMYNMAALKTVPACDKAIAADPKRADAYFIKGSALMGEGKPDKNNKIIVPPGTVEALQQYLVRSRRRACEGSQRHARFSEMTVRTLLS